MGEARSLEEEDEGQYCWLVQNMHPRLTLISATAKGAAFLRDKDLSDMLQNARYRGFNDLMVILSVVLGDCVHMCIGITLKVVLYQEFKNIHEFC